jgi:alpha-tubulin suppressor-like RCC1 family protein
MQPPWKQVLIVLFVCLFTIACENQSVPQESVYPKAKSIKDPFTSLSDHSVLKAAVAGYHMLALLEAGTVYGWGDNQDGALGIGKDTGVRMTPTQMKDPANSSGYMTGVMDIDAGFHFSVMLKSNGTVWVCGNNEFGKLGIGNVLNQSYPDQVKDPNDPTGFLTDVISVKAGTSHILALKKNGTVVSWGGNANGTLGDGSPIDHYLPVQVIDPTDPSGMLTNVIEIGAGSSHSLALKNTGEVFSWGSNSFSQLGDGTTMDHFTPVRVINLYDVRSIAAGAYHNLALNSDDTVWSWGFNFTGDLGNGLHGTGTDQSSPIRVIDPTDPTGYLTDVSAISGGGHMALKKNGVLLAWGPDAFGQIGTGEALLQNRGPDYGEDRLRLSTAPTIVKGLSGVRLFENSGNSSIAVGTNQQVWTWGANYSAQLGDGEPFDNQHLRRFRLVRLFREILAVVMPIWPSRN